MSLSDYLSKYFPNGANGEYENQPVEIKSHFLEKFGVNVKVEGDLYLFKYNQIEAKFTYPIVHECRGHIWKYSKDGWKRVCNPFNKFFNQHEGYCPLFDRTVFNQNCPNLSVVEKLDGTCITYWNDGEKWHASTLGMITPGQVGDYPGLTFDALFFKTLGSVPNLDPAYTYIFELCCSENRIVTKYPVNTIALLGVRNNKTGEHLCENAQEEIVLELMKHGNVRMPYRTPFYSIDIKDYDSCVKWIEDQSTNEKFGELPEGFVIYDGFKPVCKMKNSRYLSLHSVGGGDIKHSRNVVIDCFFAQTIDDILPALNEHMLKFLEALRFKVQKLYGQVSEASKHLVGVHFATQKDYALAIQAHIPKEFWAFFFQHKDKVADPKCDLDELFRYWLRINHAKFEDYWKKD